MSESATFSMLKVGLTGGIATGKSTAAQFFNELGVPVIDADVIAHDVLKQPDVSRAISQHFGQKVFKHDELDKKALRKIIFAEPAQRQWLEHLLHPLILQEMQRQLETLQAPYCILVIPLLTEVAAAQHLVDRILLVDMPLELQRQRLQERDTLSTIEIDQLLAAQTQREQRLAIAQDVIENVGDLAALKEAVKKWHDFYRKKH
ncbi:MAG: dephospho-CoA kinase [Gammaproteobacteria bacterium]